jgi:hypothetical protein
MIETNVHYWRTRGTPTHDRILGVVNEIIPPEPVPQIVWADVNARVEGAVARVIAIHDVEELRIVNFDDDLLNLWLCIMEYNVNIVLESTITSDLTSVCEDRGQEAAIRLLSAIPGLADNERSALQDVVVRLCPLPDEGDGLIMTIILETLTNMPRSERSLPNGSVIRITPRDTAVAELLEETGYGRVDGDSLSLARTTVAGTDIYDSRLAMTLSAVGRTGVVESRYLLAYLLLRITNSETLSQLRRGLGDTAWAIEYNDFDP